MKMSKVTLSGLMTVAFGLSLLAPAIAQKPAEGGQKPGQPGQPGARRQRGAEQGRRNPGERLQRMDKNKDGKLSKDELPAQAWERLSRFDANKDGFLTKEELARAGAGLRGRRNPDAMFQQMDKNKDGRLTRDEVPAQAWERLSRADANKDGAITKEELAQMRGRRGAGPGGPGAPGKPGRQGRPGAPKPPIL